MSDKTRTVYTTLPLMVDGAKQPAGAAMTLPEVDAQTLVDEGRATDTDPAAKPAPEKAKPASAPAVPAAPPAAPAA